jgi:hypothetical protein
MPQVELETRHWAAPPDTPSTRGDRQAIEIGPRQHKINGDIAIVRTRAAVPRGPMDLIDQLIAGLPSFHDQVAGAAVHRAGIENT